MADERDRRRRRRRDQRRRQASSSLRSARSCCRSSPTPRRGTMRPPPRRSRRGVAPIVQARSAPAATSSAASPRSRSAPRATCSAASSSCRPCWRPKVMPPWPPGRDSPDLRRRGASDARRRPSARLCSTGSRAVRRRPRRAPIGAAPSPQTEAPRTGETVSGRSRCRSPYTPSAQDGAHRRLPLLPDRSGPDRGLVPDRGADRAGRSRRSSTT